MSRSKVKKATKPSVSIRLKPKMLKFVDMFAQRSGSTRTAIIELAIKELIINVLDQKTAQKATT